MKRDYTSGTVDEINTYLSNAYNGTNNDYRDPYYDQSVPYDHKNLKYEALCVGSDANNHIQSIRDKLDDAMSVLSQFHSDVETTSNQIFSMANNIIAILNEINSSMNSINSILSGLGDYSGKTITPDDVEAAGIDEDKCAIYKQNFYDSYLKNDSVVTQYIEEMKTLESQGEVLSPEDTDKLKRIYHRYCDLRFDSNNNDNINNISDQDLQNGIDAFELLCPEAKEATDKFFEYPLNDSDPIVQKNVARIKFAIYTSPPEYRDVIIYYLPQITLLCYDGTWSVNDMYELSIDSVYIDLTVDYSKDPNRPFGSFFHEIGHGIDDLSVEDPLLNSSEEFYISIKNDFKESLDIQLEQYDLSDEEKEQLKQFILEPTTYNVLLEKDGPPKYAGELPEYWSYKQVMAYQKIREYYGYREFYIEDGTVKSIRHYGDSSFGTDITGTLNGDMFGAVTNNKMGLVPSGHWPAYFDAFLPFDDTTEGNEAIMELELLFFPYWEIDKLYGMEFFAESFKYGAQNIDTTDSKTVFGSTYEAYEKKFQEIYAGVPHYDI